MSAADLVQDARLLIEAKQWNEAQAALQQAIKQDPRNEAARFYLHLVQDARDGQTTNQGKAIPASALNTRANPVPTNNDRRRIYGKLESLRLGLVDWNGVPLGEVVGRLSEETRKRDPEGQGIRFSTTENRVTASGIVDPTSGLPIASWPTNSTDLSSISIRIAPALHDVRLADALDAIVAGADRPLKYSVLDSGVVFSPRIGKEPVPLFVRASFKVDDNIFLAGLRSATGLAATSELNSPALLNTLRDFLAKLGVDLSPPKSVFFNDRAGVLMVRATQQDLDIVEKAVQQLNATPPPLVNIEAKLIAVPEELITNDFWTSLGVPCAGHTNSTALLTPVQTAAALKTIKSNPSYRIANEAAATVRAGRQLQILCTGLQSILTNLNPHAFTPPGVSTASNNENGLYLSAKMAFGPTFYMIPYVSNDGCTIRLTVIPNLVEFLGYDEPTNSLTVYVNGKKQKASTPLPRFHVSSLTYSAIIPDGQTLVLGGLTSENVTKLKKKVSGLGDIPLLGGLFRSESTTTEKKRMLLFLTPTLIDSAGNRLNRDHQLKPPPPHKG